jgi:hypothetical protein
MPGALPYSPRYPAGACRCDLLWVQPTVQVAARTAASALLLVRGSSPSRAAPSNRLSLRPEEVARTTGSVLPPLVAGALRVGSAMVSVAAVARRVVVRVLSHA